VECLIHGEVLDFVPLRQIGAGPAESGSPAVLPALEIPAVVRIVLVAEVVRQPDSLIVKDPGHVLPILQVPSEICLANVRRMAVGGRHEPGQKHHCCNPKFQHNFLLGELSLLLGEQ